MAYRRELVIFDSAGKVVDAAGTNLRDIAFVAIDPARGAGMVQTPLYVLIEGACLVAKDSPITDNAQVDQPGIRLTRTAFRDYC